MTNTEDISKIEMYKDTIPTEGSLYSRMKFLIKKDRSLTNKEISKIIGCNKNSVNVYAPKIRKEINRDNDQQSEETIQLMTEAHEINVETAVELLQEELPPATQTEFKTAEPMPEPIQEKSSPDAYNISLKNTSPGIIEHVFADFIKYLGSDYNYDFEVTINKNSKN